MEDWQKTDLKILLRNPVGCEAMFNSVRKGEFIAKILEYIPNNEFVCEILDGEFEGDKERFNILELLEHPENEDYLKASQKL